MNLKKFGAFTLVLISGIILLAGCILIASNLGVASENKLSFFWTQISNISLGKLMLISAIGGVVVSPLVKIFFKSAYKLYKIRKLESLAKTSKSAQDTKDPKNNSDQKTPLEAKSEPTTNSQATELSQEIALPNSQTIDSVNSPKSEQQPQKPSENE